jgi:hypothetical protein
LSGPAARQNASTSIGPTAASFASVRSPIIAGSARH